MEYTYGKGSEYGMNMLAKQTGEYRRIIVCKYQIHKLENIRKT